MEKERHSMSEDSVKADEGEIIFKTGNPPQPMMTLTKDGFIYKGQKIEDAGAAYNLFVDWLKTASTEQT